MATGLGRRAEAAHTGVSGRACVHVRIQADLDLVGDRETPASHKSAGVSGPSDTGEIF